MKEDKYQKLIEKLNKYIDNDGVDPSVSPTLGSSGGKATTLDSLYLTRDMNIDSLNKNQLILAHALLHQFYGCGGTKELTKLDIEQLHAVIKEKINHNKFDRLDESERKNKRSA